MMKDPCATIQKIVTARPTPGGAIEVIQRIGMDYRPLCFKRKCEEAEQQLIEGYKQTSQLILRFLTGTQSERRTTEDKINH